MKLKPIDCTGYQIMTRTFRIWDSKGEPHNWFADSCEVVTTRAGKVLKLKSAGKKQIIFAPDQWEGFTEVVPEIVPKAKA